MTNIEQLLQWGILDPYELPLGTKNDFTLRYNIVRIKNPKNREERRTYLETINIFYKNELLVDDLIKYTEFRESLKTFITAKGQFEDERNIFFESSLKTKNGMISLQLLEKNRYIGIREASQILSLLNQSTGRHSNELLLEKYRLNTINFISSEKNKEIGNLNLKNTVVMDLMKQNEKDRS